MGSRSIPATDQAGGRHLVGATYPIAAGPGGGSAPQRAYVAFARPE